MIRVLMLIGCMCLFSFVVEAKAEKVSAASDAQINGWLDTIKSQRGLKHTEASLLLRLHSKQALGPLLKRLRVAVFAKNQNERSRVAYLIQAEKMLTKQNAKPAISLLRWLASNTPLNVRGRALRLLQRVGTYKEPVLRTILAGLNMPSFRLFRSGRMQRGELRHVVVGIARHECVQSARLLFAFLKDAQSELGKEYRWMNAYAKSQGGDERSGFLQHRALRPQQRVRLFPWPMRLVGAILRELGPGCASALPTLRKHLKSRKQQLQWGAIQVLKGMGEKAAGVVPALLTLYKKDPRAHRDIEAVIHSIGVKGRAFLPSLTQKLKTLPLQQQLQYVPLLQRLGEKKKVHTLLHKGLTSKNASLISVCASQIVRLRREKGIFSTAELLSLVRRPSILSNMFHSSILSVFSVYLKRRYPASAWALLKQWSSLPTRAQVLLFGVMTDAAKRKANMQGILRNWLRKQLVYKKGMFREQAIQSLSLMGDVALPAQKQLLALFPQASWKSKKAMLSLFLSWGKKAKPALTVLRQELTRMYPKTRKYVVEKWRVRVAFTLFRLGDEVYARKILLQKVKHKEPYIRHEAYRYLQKIRLGKVLLAAVGTQLLADSSGCYAVYVRPHRTLPVLLKQGAAAIGVLRQALASKHLNVRLCGVFGLIKLAPSFAQVWSGVRQGVAQTSTRARTQALIALSQVELNKQVRTQLERWRAKAKEDVKRAIHIAFLRDLLRTTK
ncbi:MAG TPA: hypothetical protein DCE42_21490 [Myxococcales bacterium]|nr:hypothetical protein [Deltaproteobacteria bacterium]HAA57354.1 hypothetical protein [Myxococcales bacterium]